MYLETKIPYANAWINYARELGISFNGMLVTYSIYFGEEFPRLNQVVQSRGVIDDFGNFVEVPL